MVSYKGSVDDISHSYLCIEPHLQRTQHGGMLTEQVERFDIGQCPKIKIGELFEESRVAIEGIAEMRGFNWIAKEWSVKMQMSAVGIEMLEQSCRDVSREYEFF